MICCISGRASSTIKKLADCTHSCVFETVTPSAPHARKCPPNYTFFTSLVSFLIERPGTYPFNGTRETRLFLYTAANFASSARCFCARGMPCSIRGSLSAHKRQRWENWSLPRQACLSWRSPAKFTRDQS